MSTSPMMRRRVALLAATLLCTTLGVQLPTGALAAPGEARLEVRRASQDVKVMRFKGEPIYLDLGIYVASIGEAFELHASRPSYTEPVELTQILRRGGAEQRVVLPAELLDGWTGLSGFLRTQITKLDGTTVIDQTLLPQRVRASTGG